jgi:predicted nucleic acid-binding protein
MIVVADTSPHNYLIQIGCDPLLPQLYGCIVAPAGVIRELGHQDAPLAVSAWLKSIPDWIEIREAPLAADLGLLFLDLGEREAIQLAEEQKADLLLIDERKGRQEAKRRGLRTTGTLGVLLTAGELQLIDAESAYRRLLLDTTFRTSAALESYFLRQIDRGR